MNTNGLCRMFPDIGKFGKFDGLKKLNEKVSAIGLTYVNPCVCVTLFDSSGKSLCNSTFVRPSVCPVDR